MKNTRKLNDEKIQEMNNESLDREQLIQITEGIIYDTKLDLTNKKVHSIPIAEMAILGAGIAELIPAFRTVTQTVSLDTTGLYRLTNKGLTDVLKTAKNGNYWGALKTTEGKSKMLQLTDAGAINGTTKAVAAINPAVLLMAVALFSIEKHLDKIEEIGTQILKFLDIEKESEIEADIKRLVNILSKYKYNWDNEQYIASNHKLVIDIQRTAEKHMISYQKKVNDIIKNKKILVAQTMVNSTLEDLQKKYVYYKLSLYTYAMASFIEIMLSGNFQENNILNTKTDIEKYVIEYREIFTESSLYLEKMNEVSVEKNVLKGIGTASKAVGKFIGSIPVVKEGLVDEFLQDSGEKIKDNANNMQKKVLETFAELSDPGVSIFLEKMDDMIAIYNHTDDICFDNEKVYFVAA